MSAAWVLVPSLVSLRAEFDRLAPGRDHASDGTIGDAAHQAEVSDHNDDEVGNVPIHDADHVHEVHALDVDTDFRVPGLTMRMVVDHIVARCRSGAENRLRYVIYDHEIAEASNGWRWRTYDGASPHTEHAHFSASYDSLREADTRSWTLEDIPVALTDDDKKWYTEQMAAVAAKVWATKVDIDTTKTGTNLQPTGSVLAYTSSEHHQILDRLDALAAAVANLTPPPAG